MSCQHSVSGEGGLNKSREERTYQHALAQTRGNLVPQVVDAPACLDVRGGSLFLHPLVLVAENLHGRSSRCLDGIAANCAQGQPPPRQWRYEGADRQRVHRESRLGSQLQKQRRSTSGRKSRMQNLHESKSESYYVRQDLRFRFRFRMRIGCGCARRLAERELPSRRSTDTPAATPAPLQKEEGRKRGSTASPKATPHR